MLTQLLKLLFSSTSYSIHDAAYCTTLGNYIDGQLKTHSTAFVSKITNSNCDTKVALSSIESAMNNHGQQINNIGQEIGSVKKIGIVGAAAPFMYKGLRESLKFGRDVIKTLKRPKNKKH